MQDSTEKMLLKFYIWLARSPSLDAIKNFCGILARSISFHGSINLSSLALKCLSTLLIRTSKTFSFDRWRKTVTRYRTRFDFSAINVS